MSNREPKEITFRRKIVVCNVKRDFGLGPGVIYVDEITYSNKHASFDSSMFGAQVMRDTEDLIKKNIRVDLEEKK